MDVKQGVWEEVEQVNLVEGGGNWQAGLNRVMHCTVRGIS